MHISGHPSGATPYNLGNEQWAWMDDLFNYHDLGVDFQLDAGGGQASSSFNNVLNTGA